MLAIVLIALLALPACTVSRSALQGTEIRTQSSEFSSDTLRDHVVVTILDTVKEVTTITVRESETGDTLRVTTVTDRTRASTRDRVHDVQEKLIVKTDTVFVEKQQSEVTEITSQPSIGSGTARNEASPGDTFARILKWLFWLTLAVIILIIIFKIIT